MVSLSAVLTQLLVLCFLRVQAELPARNVVEIVSAVGLANSSAAKPDTHDYAGFLRGNLSSQEGVSVSTDPAPAFNRSEYESYLWYVYQDRDPATNAEFYRLYFAPTLNETAIFGHADCDSDRPLFSRSVRSDNNPSTPGTAFTWNVTLTEFESYPPFGFAETYYQIRSSTNNSMVLTLLPDESRVTLAPLIEPFVKEQMWVWQFQPFPCADNPVQAARVANQYIRSGGRQIIQDEGEVSA
ncbi:hypothetical protein R3P38DRAFT_2808391 [Favolaschia claudopus]|uniref:Uncharacterized protein n=1 Tax=Favolaschia claudopus TaxID=2862362 RepID=A0AAV9ZG50_9AGAR